MAGTQNKKNFKVKKLRDPLKKKMKNGTKAAIVSVVSVALMVALGFSSWALINNMVMSKPSIPDETESDVTQNPGVETPSGAKEKQINILLCGIDSTEVRGTTLTDTIMVANFDFENKRVSILQIPRDTYVGIDVVYTGKINAVYPAGKNGKGINGLKNVIYDQFKINLDYYVTIDMDGFSNLVDAIGGVEVHLEKSFFFQEEGQSAVSLQPGKNLLNGFQAQAFVRERANRGSDIERIKQGQRAFMAGFINKMMNMSKSEIVTKVVPTAFQYIKTDFTANEALKYVDDVLAMDMANMTMTIVPGEGATVKGQSVYAAHLDELVEIINSQFRAHLEPITKADLKLEEVRHTNGYYDDTETDISSLLG